MRRKYLYAAAGFLMAFALWTAAVCVVDVQSIGPMGSAVGFAALNSAFHRLTGLSMQLYTVTDWLGLVPVAVGMIYACLGLIQWIRCRQIRRVDRGILVLGAYYLLVIAAYLLFEIVVINCRPVLIDGSLEASYPSSTTLLVLCVMTTADMDLRDRIGHPALRRWAALTNGAFVAFMVIGRLVSGVHWLTDIIGGILLSAGLILIYAAFRKHPDRAFF